MVVSRDQLHRALLLVHSLTAGALRRGWKIEAYTEPGYREEVGVALLIGSHRYPIEVHEKTRTLPFTEAEVESWRNEWSWSRQDRANKMPPPQLKRREATGTLQLRLPHGYRGGRVTWTDGPRSLNGRLDLVFAALDERVEADDHAAEQARIRQEEYRREQQRREETARLRRIDDARAKRAAAEATAWRQANDLAEYAAALRARLPHLAASDRERIEPWCNWIEDRVRRSDPTQATLLIVGLDDERDDRGW